jgi:phosphate transport system substrate-binding protein
MRQLLLAIVSATALAVGCRKAPETETLLIAGSSTMQSYLDPVVKAFVAANPSVSIVSEGGGSTPALVALNHGAIDVAGITRTVTAKEDDVYLRDYLVARDGVAIVVNPANSVDNLSKDQLTGIFEGTIKSWKAVGGSHQVITVVVRESKSNVRRSVEDLLLGGDEIPVGFKTASSATEMLEAVRSTPTGIGFLTLRTMGPGVKALRVDEVEMSRTTMLSGRYPLARSFYLVMHMKVSPLAERFVDFVLSKDGQDLLASRGLLEVF